MDGSASSGGPGRPPGDQYQSRSRRDGWGRASVDALPAPDDGGLGRTRPRRIGAQTRTPASKTGSPADHRPSTRRRQRRSPRGCGAGEPPAPTPVGGARPDPRGGISTRRPRPGTATPCRCRRPASRAERARGGSSGAVRAVRRSSWPRKGGLPIDGVEVRLARPAPSATVEATRCRGTSDHSARARPRRRRPPAGSRSVRQALLDHGPMRVHAPAARSRQRRGEEGQAAAAQPDQSHPLCRRLPDSAMAASRLGQACRRLVGAPASAPAAAVEQRLPSRAHQFGHHCRTVPGAGASHPWSAGAPAQTGPRWQAGRVRRHEAVRPRPPPRLAVGSAHAASRARSAEPCRRAGSAWASPVSCTDRVRRAPRRPAPSERVNPGKQAGPARAPPATHARPPDTTETAGVAAAATAPASTSPRRGPPVTTAMLTAESRPRSRSGTSAAGSCCGTPPTPRRRPPPPPGGTAPAAATREPEHGDGQPHTTTATSTARPWRRTADPAGGQGARPGARARRGVQQPDRPRPPPNSSGAELREQRPGHAEHHGVDVDERTRPAAPAGPAGSAGPRPRPEPGRAAALGHASAPWPAATHDRAARRCDVEPVGGGQRRRWR